MADSVQAAQEDVFASLVGRKKWRLHHIVFLAAGIGFLAWCADGVNLRPKELASGIPKIVEYFVLMVPPKWGFFEKIWKPVKAHMDGLGIAGDIDLITYSAGFPYAVDFKSRDSGKHAHASLNGLTYLIQYADEDFWDLQINPYYGVRSQGRRVRLPRGR